MEPTKLAPGAEVSLSREAVGLWRQATDVAGLCKEIVIKTAIDIAGRKYVKVEGWMSIAIAHGFVGAVKSVVATANGVTVVAELRRLSDGFAITSAEGYVGADEPVWYGGRSTKYNKLKKVEEEVIYQKRPDYAIRAMAQTRAISRVCRSAFSHVVFLIDANLSTTPAEEMTIDVDTSEPGAVGHDGKIEEEKERQREKAHVDQTGGAGTAGAAKTEGKGKAAEKAPEGKKTTEVPRDIDPKLVDQFRNNAWQKVHIHFGTNGPKNFPPGGKTLGELEEKSLRWYCEEWNPKPYGNKGLSEDDKALRAACDAAKDEAFKE